MTGLAHALSLLTILPIPRRFTASAPQGAILAWFPVAGLVLGTIAWASAWGLNTLARLPENLSGTVVVSLVALTTGGLHLDGVADTFDALGGRRGDPARALEIMRDSRIGAHGATALGLLLLTKGFASATLIVQDTLALLLVAPVVARLAIVPAAALLPPARDHGLAHMIAQLARPWHILNAVALVSPVIYLVPNAVFPGAIGLACAAALAIGLSRAFGGLTGDTHGAVIELTEAAVLVAGCAG